EAACGRAMESGQEQTLEFEHTGKHLRTRLVPERGAGGAIESIVGFTDDITDRKFTEEVLRDTAEQLGLAMSAAGMGDWRWDAASDVVTLSTRAAAIFGIPPGPYMTWAMMRELVHPDDRERVRLAVERSIQAETDYDVEYRLTRGDDGARVWVAAKGRATYAADGRPAGMRGVVQDVTARRLAEQAVRDSEARFRSIFDQSAVGMFELSIDGTVLEVNPHLCRMLGRRREELVGSTAARITHPDDAGATRELLGDILAGSADNASIEKRYLRGDGSFVWAQSTVTLVRDEAGRPRHLVVIVQDTTERQRAAEATRRSEQRYRTLVDATSAIVWVTSASGAFVEPQPQWEAYSGQPWEQHRGFGWVTMIHPDDRGRIASEWGQAVALGKPFDTCGRVWHAASKAYRHFEVRAVPVPGADGRPSEWIGTITDVHDRREAEIALKQAKQEAETANRAKDQFLAVLSHELRTPLTPVVMTVAAMEMDRSLPPMVREDLSMIRRNIELETKLIDDLLDVTRIVHGKLRLQARPTDAHALLRHVLDMLRADIADKRLNVEFDLAAPDATVSADAARLQQVFWNLLKNAVKFSGERGRVTVRSTNPRPTLLHLEVIDDGVGIDAEVLPRIFNAFDQGGVGVTRRFGGLGLGLAISRALVELHGGTIAAHSDGPGRGARFVVELPTIGAVTRIVDHLGAGTSGAHRSARPDGSEVDARPRVRLLLVEDHPDTVHVLKRLLEHAGHDVRTASSVSSALDLLADPATGPLDVMVSDIGLPDATGHDLMRQAKVLRPDLLGIAVSGFGMDTDLRESNQAGFAAHITKPVDVQHLEATIRELVKSRPNVPRDDMSLT
ncbi:MAG: PAS domain S-box protein, partial [Tepidisphaeraceae bacterium]